MMEEKKNVVLEINNLSISFSVYDKGLRKRSLEVIHELNLNAYKGEIIAVVGSSGSGKSILAHSVMGILPKNARVQGSMKFCGKNLNHKYIKEIRGKKIAFIPQSIDFLDPLMKICKQVMGPEGNRDKMKTIFKKYELDEKVGDMYPFQLSGGMARRVLISMAMMNEVKLIVADEPTPGLSLDLAINALNSFRELADSGCAIVLITHDIDLALNVADRIAVFYSGTIVEITDVEDFKKGKDYLRHPYSKAFIDALPQNSFRGIGGFQPYAGNLPKGCLFQDRCPNRTSKCSGKIDMRMVRGGKVRCINAD